MRSFIFTPSFDCVEIRREVLVIGGGLWGERRRVGARVGVGRFGGLGFFGFGGGFGDFEFEVGTLGVGRGGDVGVDGFEGGSGVLLGGGGLGVEEGLLG